MSLHSSTISLWSSGQQTRLAFLRSADRFCVRIFQYFERAKEERRSKISSLGHKIALWHKRPTSITSYHSEITSTFELPAICSCVSAAIGRICSIVPSSQQATSRICARFLSGMSGGELQCEGKYQQTIPKIIGKRPLPREVYRA